MSMELSSDKEQLVLKNQRLVYYIVNKMGISQGSLDYEDIVAEGMMGLIKAAITFDPQKKNAFATYATKCINNEIFMYFRKNKKHANNISLDEPIGKDGDKEITLEDTIEDPDSDFTERIAKREEFINIVSIILNCLNGKARSAILYRMGNVKEEQIAKKLKITQSYVSRIIVKAARKIEEIFNQKVYYEEVFSMTTIGEAYKISFSSRDITNFNKIFATLLQNVKSAEELPDFQISCNKERITVQIHAHPTAFVFIAKIIQEIDDFNITFVSNKSMLNVGENASRKVNKVDNEESEDTVEISLTDEDSAEDSQEKVIEKPITTEAIPTSIDTDVNLTEDTDSTPKKGNYVKQVRDYMLTFDSFTSKELKEHFPGLPASTIGNALYLAKSKGLITSNGKGKYIVNKT